MSLPSVTWSLVESAAVAASSGSTITPGEDWALDDDGDLELDGDVVMTTGVDAVGQALQLALALFQGEWFLDLDEGVPYYQSILGQRYDQNTVRDIFRTAILGAHPAIQSMTRLVTTFDAGSRHLSVEFEVKTDVGLLSGTAEV